MVAAKTMLTFLPVGAAMLHGREQLRQFLAKVDRPEPSTVVEHGFTEQDPLDIRYFTRQYNGHPAGDLPKLHRSLKDQVGDSKNFIYFVGDSSLDNKYWFRDTALAENGYQYIPTEYDAAPYVKKDVGYWMNKIAADGKKPWVTINGSVEATTLGQREEGLLDQDKFVRDHISDGDVLICSIGGNDIALAPTASTIWNIWKALKLNSRGAIESGRGWGMRYLIRLFKDRIARYLEKIIGDTKVSRVMICTIYYPSIVGKGWADEALRLLGYEGEGAQTLQAMIRAAFKKATSQIEIKGLRKDQITAVPLFEILDPNDGEDYENRVEPSVQGGKKMAAKFFDAIEDPVSAAQPLEAGWWKQHGTYVTGYY